MIPPPGIPLGSRRHRLARPQHLQPPARRCDAPLPVAPFGYLPTEARDRPGGGGSEVLPAVTERWSPVGDQCLHRCGVLRDSRSLGSIEDALRDSEGELVLVLADQGAVGSDEQIEYVVASGDLGAVVGRGSRLGRGPLLC